MQNLRKFTCKKKFASVVQAYVIAHCLPKEQKEELARVFREWDTNKDGVLSREEIRNALQKCRCGLFGVFEMDHIFELMDQDKNGYVEYQEFLVMATDVRLMTTKNLLAVFNFMDKNGDGYLSVEELMIVVNNQDDTVQDILEEADTDGDGKISKQEFLALLA